MKVTLHVRIKTKDGRRKYCPPVFTANKKLRAEWAMVDGQPKHHPEAVFALRYTDRGKRVWEHVGRDPDRAVTAKLRQEHIFGGRAIGKPVPYDTQPEPIDTTRKLLEIAVKDYVAGVEARRKPKTAKAYGKALDLFEEFYPRKYLDEVTREDLVDYPAKLIARCGNSGRTAANRQGYIVTFLAHYDIDLKLKKTDKPKFTKRAPNAYSKEFVTRLLSACDAEERLVFRFFLLSGCREQEVSYACWSDLDLSRRMLTIQKKDDLNWTLKDYEERSVPLPSDLVDELKARREQRPDDRFIFPTKAGKPEGHFLRALKLVALRAGLNCGHCKSKNGQRCSKYAVCKHVELHRFRRTFATMHHQNDVSVHTLMRWLGHSDLETTLAYLAAADDENAQTRDRIDQTFAFC